MWPPLPSRVARCPLFSSPLLCVLLSCAPPLGNAMVCLHFLPLLRAGVPFAHIVVVPAGAVVLDLAGWL